MLVIRCVVGDSNIPDISPSLLVAVLKWRLHGELLLFASSYEERREEGCKMF